MRGICGDAVHEACAKPEMFSFVDGTEALTTQVPGGVERVDHRVRIRCHGEHDRDTPFAGDRAGRQGTNVGHPEVDRVDRPGRAQDPANAALGGDPSGPGTGGRDRFAQKGNRRKSVPALIGADVREG